MKWIWTWLKIQVLLKISWNDLASGSTHLEEGMAGVEDLTDINASNRKSEILDEILVRRGYNTKIRPEGQTGTGPVHVSIDIYLRNIENVDDARMEYTAQISYRQYWLDPRLKFDQIQPNISFLHLVNPERIWMPDVFFENEKTGKLHMLVTPNVFTRIFPDGRVMQSFRFTLLLSCPMNLAAYPLDIQKCPLILSTYGYSTSDVTLDWTAKNPVQRKSFRMPQFHIISYKNDVCNLASTVGEFSCLILQIELERAFGFFLLQFYIPCAMVVLVSWVGFWLEPTAVEARVSLGVTTILTIVSQTYGINQSVPQASYIKALDIWTAICQILIFGGLIQFALVNYTSHLTSPMLKRLQTLKFKEREFGRDMHHDLENEELEKLKVGIEKAKRIDKISRLLFPGIFFTFNIFYWISYGMLQ